MESRTHFNSPWIVHLPHDVVENHNDLLSSSLTLDTYPARQCIQTSRHWDAIDESIPILVSQRVHPGSRSAMCTTESYTRPMSYSPPSDGAEGPSGL